MLKKLLFISYFLFFSELNALTFKSDGTVISSSNETEEKSQSSYNSKINSFIKNHKALYQIAEGNLLKSDCLEGLKNIDWDYQKKIISLTVIPQEKMCDSNSNQAVNQLSSYQGISIQKSHTSSFEFNLTEGYQKNDQSLFLLATPDGECNRRGKWHLQLGTKSGKVGVRFVDPATNRKTNLMTSLTTDILTKKWNKLEIQQEPNGPQGVPLKIKINDEIVFDNYFDSADCPLVNYKIANVRSNNGNAKGIQTLQVKNFLSSSQEALSELPPELQSCYDYYNTPKNDKIIIFGPSTVDPYRETCESVAHHLSLNSGKYIDQFTDGGFAGFTNVTPSKKRMDYIIKHYQINLNDYDWIVYNGTIDHSYKIGSSEQFFIDLTNQILSADLTSGKFLEIFGEAIDNGKQLIISSPTRFSNNLKEKKYKSIADTSVLINKRYEMLAKKYPNVHWLPLNDGFIDPDNPDFYTEKYDGVHHSKLGAKTIGEGFAKYIKEIENEI